MTATPWKEPTLRERRAALDEIGVAFGDRPPSWWRLMRDLPPKPRRKRKAPKVGNCPKCRGAGVRQGPLGPYACRPCGGTGLVVEEVWSV